MAASSPLSYSGITELERKVLSESGILDGGKKAEVIIKTDKVSDVGRIFDGVENGLKGLAKVKLIYYIDKGWVVEDCDI